jgi:hypothetical protein
MSNLKVMRDGIRIAKFIWRERFGGQTAKNTLVREDSTRELPHAQELSPVVMAVPPEAL